MMSSVNHNDFAHLRIPLEDVLSATYNFSYLNLVGADASEKDYMGQLLWSGELINIFARRLNKEWFDGDQQFWMEVSILSSLKHKNLVSLVGFCDENDEKVIIYKRETRLSLSNYLSHSMSLTWVRRLKICVSIAQALSYIHYDESRDFSVIHRYITSGTIFLNDDWEPKLGDFILSVKVKASERHNSFNTDKVWSTDGDTDPTYIETKSANHKSDIYSFGIVMFELLCGRKAVIEGDQDNKYLASVAVAHYREKKLNEIIDSALWNQMDSQSFNIFAEIAYECLNEERSQRPNIDEIVTRLEKALELQLEHQNAISSLKENLAHLKIPLEKILSATNNFHRYEGQLSWSDNLIDIYARRLKRVKEREFWMEVSLLSSLKHKNVVSLVGFCDEKIIITRHETRGRLDRYLSNLMMLTWVRRLEISVGIAQALSYIHYDESRDFSVIHRNISSKAVLLNDDWEPKLSEFQHSMKIKASERHHSFHNDSVWSMKGYTDPTYEKTKSVSHMSDIYSFGILLFELLCGRESVIDDHDNKYLAPVALFHYREKILDEIIDPDLLNQIDPRSLKIFAETAYACLSEEQSQRPNMDQIGTRLEEALKLQLEWKNAMLKEHSSVVAEVGETSSSLEKGSVTFASIGNESQVSKNTKSFLNDLSLLKLSLQDLLSATNYFDEEHFNKDERIFKGRLLRSEQFIDIFGKFYLSEDESKKFSVELSMLSSLKHKNLVSPIGFCDEEVRVIVFKKETNESLKNHLSDQTLTWMQRLKICVGIGNALSYIHYDAGRDFSVIHCNVRSSKILLDDEWEPKLSGFELALKNTVARRHRLLLTRDIVKNVYFDPKYEESGGVTHKSDVYSFGVVLFEVLCSRSSVDDDDSDDDSNDEGDDKDNELREGLLSQLAKSHLDEMIMPHLRRQMDPEALKIFSDTAYWCIKEDRADRPYIDQVVKRLEKALELQSKHENPVNRTSSVQLKVHN